MTSTLQTPKKQAWAPVKQSFDMTGPEIYNKWNKDRLTKTPIQPGMIKNMPNQRYLDVSPPQPN